MSIITLQRKVLEKNDEIAEKNREVFTKHKIFTINFVSSPGSGKTSIIERTLETLKDRISISIIEGDVQTSLDAQRLAKFDVPVVQIITQGLCHLEANLVRDAIENISINDVKLLLIENVGNLVCPAVYDLGEDIKAVIVSTTEGEDKPLKYPRMFQNALVLIINKTDLLPYVDFNLESFKRNAFQINPSLTIFQLSCKTGEGINSWCEWLEQKILEKK